MRARRQSIFFIRPNHFWLDAEESGLCHIGIDGFLADVAGKADGITFVTVHGTHCPAVALTIHGVEWPMSFPNPLMIQKVNSRVRSDPARLTADPYGAGWLFEGLELPGRTRAGLVSGRQAAAWQAEEQERLTQEIHETHAPGCDGGSPVRGVAQLLSRPNLVCLLQHFFSPEAGRGRNDESAEHDRVRARAGDSAGGGMDCVSARALRAAAAAVEFLHKTHAEKSGVADCGECHAFREDGTFAGIPAMEKCAGCHSERIGQSKAEATLVDNFIKPGHETPWLVYARQPANVWFSHAIHVKRAGLACMECHSTYGESDQVRVYQVNRISGYSRDIWGHSMSRLRRAPHEGMKMSDCEDCHRRRNVEVGCLGCHE